ncbi:MAG: hypothetical protein MJY87_02170 [Fibrobacter sp.]|nr:hypothetical protein [Fibrobacter sp.]
MNRLTKFLFLSLLASTSAFSQKIQDGNSIKTVQIGNKTWMAENLSTRAQLGTKGREVCYSSFSDSLNIFLFEDAKTACPEGWRLPSDIDWDNLLRQANHERGDNEHITINQALMKGTWGIVEAETECDYDSDGNPRFQYNSPEWKKCQIQMKNLVEGYDLVGFAARGFSPNSFNLGSECREGCGGPIIDIEVANFWSSSGKIFQINMLEKKPTLKKYPNPRKGSDDCSNGYGGYGVRTKFSLNNVGKTVASVRCIKD